MIGFCDANEKKNKKTLVSGKYIAYALLEIKQKLAK